MIDEQIGRDVFELEKLICKSKFLYGSKSYGWATYKVQDLELDRSINRSSTRWYKGIRVSTPDMLIDCVENQNFLYYEKPRWDQLWYTGNIDQLPSILTQYSVDI